LADGLAETFRGIEENIFAARFVKHHILNRTISPLVWLKTNSLNSFFRETFGGWFG
jgi:hypothetical protein